MMVGSEKTNPESGRKPVAETSNANASGSGVPVIIAALILGASVIGGALLVRASLDQVTAELAQVGEVVADLPATPPPAARQRQAAQPNRPDPNERYEIATAGSPARGPEDAEIEIVEFSDFQCPFCGRVTPTLKQVEEEYGDRVRIVFKHLPLSIHPKAPAAHAAAEAAHRQGKFWEMHDKIFANQREMSPEKYRVYAEELGLDLAQFDKDVADPALKKRIDSDTQQAAKLLVRGTPGFFINGRFLSGAQPFASFKRLIDEELDQG
jgi:protein-disulfide isomerase